MKSIKKMSSKMVQRQQNGLAVTMESAMMTIWQQIGRSGPHIPEWLGTVTSKRY